jgi:putative component of membrane protein insertase Oxa1/YidC/SpoIIIJ protein YidD
MNPKISELLERIRQIQEEIEQEVQRRRAELHADFEHRRIRFEREVLEQQRRFRAGLLAYLFGAELRHVVTAPVIYAVFVPLVLADLCVTLYQLVCFPAYRIPLVRRSEHFFYDRSHLAYLNLIEKFNCAYCSYANGLASYIREIIARTEQYWCPIKHARRLLHAHPYYDGFVDYGDAEGYRRELQALRAALAELEAAQRK